MAIYPSPGSKAAKAKEKPPIPKYHYKLVSVASSADACRMETALRDKLDGTGLTFFAICHKSGRCDVMGDSGRYPLQADALANAKAVAAKVKKN